MNQPIRTFVAVEVAPAVRQRIAQLVERLRSAEAAVKWVATDNLHLTLKFLGDVDPHQIHEVCEAVATAVAGVSSFTIESRGAGAFPNTSRPRTLWLGVGQGATELGQLHEKIDAEVGELGFAAEARKFQPHLTIGRLRGYSRGIADLAKQLERAADFDAGETKVGEIVVFASQLERNGPRYEALSRAKLAG